MKISNIVCKFQYNSLANYTDQNNGIGTIAFYGANFIMNDVWFSDNKNTKAAGVYIDGSSQSYEVAMNFSKIIFERNQAFVRGAGIVLAKNLWIIRSYAHQIFCISNKAYGKVISFFLIILFSWILHMC